MYIELADISKAIPGGDLIALTDDAQTGVADAAVITAAIADACGTIDGVLYGRYTTPLATPSPLIKTIATDLALHYLYSRRVDIAPPEAIVARRKTALKLLDQVRSGEILLGAPSGQPTPATGNFKTNKTGEDRIFS